MHRYTDSVLFYAHTYTDVTFYAHLQNPTTIHTQRYAKIQRYTDSMHTQILWLLDTPKDIQSYKDIQILCTPKGYDYYTFPKIYKDVQRYKDI